MAIELDPLNVNAHHKKGYSLFYLARDSESVTAFEQALKIDPNFVNATFGLAHTTMYLEKYNEAISLYHDGLSVQPNDIYALGGLGISLSQLGDKSAIEYIDQALNISPDNIDILFFKGWAFLNLERYEEAIVYYDKVLAIDPNDIDALNDKGFAK